MTPGSFRPASLTYLASEFKASERLCLKKNQSGHHLRNYTASCPLDSTSVQPVHTVHMHTHVNLYTQTLYTYATKVKREQISHFPVYSSQVSIAVTKYHNQKQREEEKVYSSLQFSGHNPSLRIIKPGTGDASLEARTKATSMDECCLLACSP